MRCNVLATVLLCFFLVILHDWIFNWQISFLGLMQCSKTLSNIISTDWERTIGGMKLHQYFELGPASQDPFSFCQIQIALDTVYSREKRYVTHLELCLGEHWPDVRHLLQGQVQRLRMRHPNSSWLSFSKWRPKRKGIKISWSCFSFSMTTYRKENQLFAWGYNS